MANQLEIDSVIDLMDAVLPVVETALLLANPGETINRTVATFGDVAWDECDCGQLALTVTNMYPSNGFSRNDTWNPRGNCSDAIFVAEFDLSMVRCVPIPDDSGRAPTPAALHEAARIAYRDAFTMRETLVCWLPAQVNVTIADHVVGDATPLGQLGGCGGFRVPFRVGWYTSCECAE